MIDMPSLRQVIVSLDGTIFEELHGAYYFVFYNYFNQRS
jgi:hypothetical protein